jgi:hypothetical protein
MESGGEIIQNQIAIHSGLPDRVVELYKKAFQGIKGVSM